MTIFIHRMVFFYLKESSSVFFPFILSLSISGLLNGQGDLTANGTKSESKISKVLNLKRKIGF